MNQPKKEDEELKKIMSTALRDYTEKTGRIVYEMEWDTQTIYKNTGDGPIIQNLTYNDFKIKTSL